MKSAPFRPLKERRPASAAAGSALSGVDPLMARIYANRGIADASQLDHSLQRMLPVSSLGNIDAAVELLLRHRSGRVIIVGDFDADGATSTALVTRCLRKFGFADVSYLVPNRFEYGYGLTPEIVRVAATRSPDLLLTVDNGVSSVDGVALAHELGIAVLVTDHHLPGSTLPDADVILNPNLPDNEFRSKNLAGVGVAFYLMAALGRRLESDGLAGAARIPAGYLDLVALGTVADVVALDQNNRILVSEGLRRIRAGQCIAGIPALVRVAGRDPSRIVSGDLGFAVGPRLNAAGRLEDMSIGIECLLTDDAAVADRLATQLDQINRDRQQLESGMREQAFEFVDRMDSRNLPPCVCVYDPSWHQGVVGLVASRVKDRCHRPVIAFARDHEGQLKGSARSVSGVHVRDLLEAVATAEPGLITRFGGHAMAAGLTLEESSLPRFRELASRQLMRLYPEADFSGTLLIDGRLPVEAMELGFARALRTAGPWGAGFPEPLFSGEFTVIEQRTVGENHLKMSVQPLQGGKSVSAIAFNQAGPAWRGGVQLVYRLDVNEYRGFESLQLVVEQIAPLS